MSMIWRYALACITLTLSFKWNIINRQSIHSIIVFLHLQTNSCSHNEDTFIPVNITLSNVTRLRYPTASSYEGQNATTTGPQPQQYMAPYSPTLPFAPARTSHANVSYLVPWCINLTSSLLFRFLRLLSGDTTHHRVSSICCLRIQPGWTDRLNNEWRMYTHTTMPWPLTFNILLL